MAHLTLLLSLIFCLSAQAQNPFDSFRTIRKDHIGKRMANEDLIIHETQDYYLLKSPLTNFESYDYFFVQIPDDPHTYEWILNNSNLVYTRDKKFAVLQINNEKELLAVAGKLHHEGGACGMIQKLSPVPVNFEIKDPKPLFLQKDPKIANAIKKVEVKNVIDTINTMVSWETRYHADSSGVQTGEKLMDLYKQVTPEDRSDVEFELVQHQGSEQKSLIVRIPGTVQADELLILGSHLDSINNSDNKDAPGADDNASGTSTNLEVFRVLMENGIKPLKTIEIQAYAAEEIGLVGSGEIARSYRDQGKKVEAMLQFDMNGFAKNEPKITFVTNGTNSVLNSQLSKLVDDYLEIPSASGFLIFGSSDHASWNRNGFPASFPTEDPFGFNNNIHTKEDTLNHINSPKQIEEFAKLGVVYFMTYAGF